MAFKMFNFKNFFGNNHNTDFIVEANRGDTPESSVLLDEEDLDFLYQVDYNFWTYAISTRYEVLLDELKNRDAIRKKIEAQFVKDFNSVYKTKEEREGISLDSFVDFVNVFASNFNDYGEKVSTPISDKAKFKNWEKDFRNEYGEDFDKVKKVGSRSFFHDLRYMICGYIVPFVKENKAYPLKGTPGRTRIFVPMYINRLIQKLETTKGEEITLPANNHKLLNLSRVLSKEVPVDMKKKGTYGFDLSRARTQNIPLGPNRSTALGKTRGFTFPSIEGSKSIKNLVRQLVKFNYQRHMGPLPSDENFKKFSGVNEKGEPVLTYKFVKIKRNLEDNFNYDVIKNSIKNKIITFISNNRKLSSWSKVKDHGLFDIIDSKFQNEIETGSWANTSNALTNYIIKNKSGLTQSSENQDKSLEAATYVSNWQNITGNRPIEAKFAEYFSEKQLEHLLESGKMVSGPRILDGDDEESRRQNYLRLDPESKRELEKKLSEEDINEFIKTGRLPLNLKTIAGKKKLVPGEMDYAPVVLPFLKTKVVDPDGKEQEISVPLLKPGKYLSGLSGGAIDDGESEADQDSKAQDNERDIGYEEDDSEESDKLKDFTTPSTSDRTSVYRLKDENGDEKEVKVIDASSSERYVKKPGVGGVYYSIDTKGESRKFGFNRWKKSDKYAFIKVWSHPEHSEQVFSFGDVKNKYQQLFGKRILDIYDEVDPIEFYSNKNLPDYYPFILNGYKIGKENDIPRASRDDQEDSSSNVSSATDPLGLKIIKSNSSPEIMGFPLVVKAINDCLTMKRKVCNNDGNEGFRVWLLESPQRIQDLHDYVVGQVMDGGNNGIWKTFVGDSGEKKGAIPVFCSIIGKWQQKSSNTLKSSMNHGQVGRKLRKNLIGALSVAVFKQDLSKYQEYLDGLEKKSKQSNNSNSSRLLNSIDSVKVLGDDDDDKVAEWFYPGYENSEDKGSFQTNPENFKPDMEDWRFGPPTELRNFLKSFYESDKTRITQDQKDILLKKIKDEKEFLVGNGSADQGVIGTDSYIFNKSIFDETPGENSLTIKQQIQALHSYTNQIYEKDISYVSELKVAGKKDKEQVAEDDILSDESNEYIKNFKEKFYSISPIVKKLILGVIKVNNTQDSQLAATSNYLYKFMNKPQTSNEGFVQNISILYYILSNDKNSLLKSYPQFLESLGTGTSNAEVEYVRKNPGSNTKTFLSSLNSIGEMFVDVAANFEDIIDDLLYKIKNDDAYKASISLFMKDLISKNLMSNEVVRFLRSNLYKPGGLEAPEGANIPAYFNPLPDIHKIQSKTASFIRSYSSTLRRIDMGNLTTDSGFSNIGKIKRGEIVNLINSKKENLEKSNIAKKVKDYYVKSGEWERLDSYFKRFIDSNII